MSLVRRCTSPSSPLASGLIRTAYSGVPHFFNLLVDALEKMDSESHQRGYPRRELMAQNLWAPATAGPFRAARLKSLQYFPAASGASNLRMEKGIDETIKKMEKP